MQTHHTKATIDANGSLHIDALPFSAGQTVDVIILPSTMQNDTDTSYPLRNTPIKYTEPFEPVCESDWESAQ
jgi:hypothetical protein